MSHFSSQESHGSRWNHLNQYSRQSSSGEAELLELHGKLSTSDWTTVSTVLNRLKLDPQHGPYTATEIRERQFERQFLISRFSSKSDSSEIIATFRTIVERGGNPHWAAQSYFLTECANVTSPELHNLVLLITEELSAYPSPALAEIAFVTLQDGIESGCSPQLMRLLIDVTRGHLHHSGAHAHRFGEYLSHASESVRGIVSAGVQNTEIISLQKAISQHIRAGQLLEPEPVIDAAAYLMRSRDVIPAAGKRSPHAAAILDDYAELVRASDAHKLTPARLLVLGWISAAQFPPQPKRIELMLSFAELFSELLPADTDLGTLRATALAHEIHDLIIKLPQALAHPIQGTRLVQVLRRVSGNLTEPKDILALTHAFVGALEVVNVQKDSPEFTKRWRLFEEALGQQLAIAPQLLSLSIVQLGVMLRANPKEEDLRAWLTLRAQVLSFSARQARNHLNIIDGAFRTALHRSAPPSLLMALRGLVALEPAARQQQLMKQLRTIAVQGSVALLKLPASSVADAERHIDELAELMGILPSDLRGDAHANEEYRMQQEREYSPLVGRYDQDSRSLGGDRQRRFIPNETPISELLSGPAQRVYRMLARLDDIKHGFGSLRAETQRTPDGEVPSLVRFAQDIGAAFALNARSNNVFPGKGFGISQLKPERFLALDTRARSRFEQLAPYKRAWPGYAHALDDIAAAEYLYVRGIQVISCPGRRYELLHTGGHRVQWSLLIFNAHFENPNLEGAILVRTERLKALIKGCILAMDNYVGYSDQRQDIHSAMSSIEKLVADLVASGDAIRVGDPRGLAHGITGEEHAAHRDYQRRLAVHQENVKKFDAAFRKSRGGTMDSSYQREMELHHDAEALVQQALQLNKRVFSDHAVIELVHDLLNLYDLSKIALAFWHRGLTINGSGEDAPTEIELDESIAIEETEAALNPNGTRMLHELYRWHALRAQGVEDRARFYLGVPANALSQVSREPAPFWVDSYDMTLHFADGRVVQFNQGAPLMEDELYWLTQVVPLIKDEEGKIADFLLAHRDSVPLGNQRKETL